MDVDVAGGDDVVQINADDPGRGRRAGLDTFQERQRRLQQMHIVCRAGGVQLFAQVGLQFLRAGIGRQHGDVDRGVAGRQARQQPSIRVAKRGSSAPGRVRRRAGGQRRDDQRDGVHAVAPPIHTNSEVAADPQWIASTSIVGPSPDRRLANSWRSPYLNENCVRFLQLVATRPPQSLDAGKGNPVALQIRMSDGLVQFNGLNQLFLGRS